MLRNHLSGQQLYAWAALAVLLIITLLLIRGEKSVPDVVPESAPEQEFSGERAFSHLENISSHQRWVGASGHDYAREYIVAELEKMGLEPEVQHTTGVHKLGGVRSADVQNIVVKIPGTRPTGGIALMSHYDSVMHSYGAGDAAAGVSAIMETARAITAGEPFENDIFLLITDSEETGLIGAEAFLSEHSWADEIDIILNLEGRGVSGKAHLFRSVGENPGPLLKEVASHIPEAAATSVTNFVLDVLPFETDLSNFQGAGCTGLDIAFVEGFKYYHTSEDVAERMDPRSIQHLGYYGLGLVQGLGNADLNDIQGGGRTYFNFPLLGIVHYSTNADMFLAILSVLLVMGGMIYGFIVRKIRPARVLIGLAIYLGVLVLLTAIGFLIYLGLSRAIGDIQWYWLAGPENNAFYLLAVFGMVIALFTGGYYLLSRKLTTPELAFGPLLLLAVAALILVFGMPGTAYPLYWPAIFGALLVFWWIRKPEPSHIDWLIIFASALPAMLLIIPLIYAAEVVLAVRGMVILTVLLMILLGFLIPQLITIAQILRWKLPAGFAILAVIGLSGAWMTSGFSAETPRPNSVNYVADLTEERAFWFSGDPQTDGWSEQYLGSEPERKQFTELGFDHFAHPLINGLTGEYFVNDAPVISGYEPEVEILEDTNTENGRSFALNIKPAPDAHITELFIPGSEQPPELLYIDHRELVAVDPLYPDQPYQNPNYFLRYHGNPEEGFEVRFIHPEQENPQLRIASHIPGLPETGGSEFSAKNDSMMTFTLTDFTRTYKTFSLDSD